MDALIPLRFGCNKVIQVGDHEQLPATVQSNQAQNIGLAQSLFERVNKHFKYLDDSPMRMLTVQYRMHKDICHFPSANFYKGNLETGGSIMERAPLRGCHTLVPYQVFDIHEGQESKDPGGSGKLLIYNTAEATFVVELCRSLILRNIAETSIGIITPYARQVQHIKDLFRDSNLSRVEVGTVDGYQGREKDVIIFSSVRANPNGDVGFLSVRQRLNVSLTRAKYALYVVCNASTLRKSKHDDLRRFIADAEQRGAITANKRFKII